MIDLNQAKFFFLLLERNYAIIPQLSGLYRVYEKQQIIVPLTFKFRNLQTRKVCFFHCCCIAFKFFFIFFFCCFTFETWKNCMHGNLGTAQGQLSNGRYLFGNALRKCCGSSSPFRSPHFYLHFFFF